MRLAFPAMNMVEIVEILGSYLQTSRRNQTGYPKPKVAAALTDCKLIATLPTSLPVREHLLATKVIPRIAFTPGMTRIPKAILEKLQSAIAETIWKDRPMWRSRGLLFAVLAKPHRTEPICARAYITLLETIDYLNRSPGARDTWEALFEADAFNPLWSCSSPWLALYSTLNGPCLFSSTCGARWPFPSWVWPKVISKFFCRSYVPIAFTASPRQPNARMFPLLKASLINKLQPGLSSGSVNKPQMSFFCNIFSPWWWDALQRLIERMRLGLLLPPHAAFVM